MHRRCPRHNRLMPWGIDECWLCESHPIEIQRCDLLIRLGLGEIPQTKITRQMIIAAAIKKGRAIDMMLAQEVA